MKILKKNFLPKVATTRYPRVEGGLRAWLARLQGRGGHLDVMPDGTVCLAGAAPIPEDQIAIQAYRWALGQAMSPRWAKWWAFVTGRNQPPDWPGTYEIPLVADQSCVEGLAHGCACCGWPADRLDPTTMLAWCGDHHDPATPIDPQLSLPLETEHSHAKPTYL